MSKEHRSWPGWVWACSIAAFAATMGILIYHWNQP